MGRFLIGCCAGVGVVAAIGAVVWIGATITLVHLIELAAVLFIFGCGICCAWR